MMKVATVYDKSVPLSMILRQSGIISVWSKNEITSGSSTLTRAPTTPSDVSLKYSNERPLLTVLRKGYRKRVIWAFRKSGLVSLCEATHWRRANTLQALLDVLLSRRGGERSGYTDTISCSKAAIVPTECQMKGANSEKCSLCLESSSRALSLFSAYLRSSICFMISYFSCSDTPEFYINVVGWLMLNSVKCSVVSTMFYDTAAD